MKLNAQNERIKHRYFAYLKEAKQLDVQSIDAVAKALDRFEGHTRRRDFKSFRPEQAISFKGCLAEERNVRSGEKLSKATIVSTLNVLKAFFFWLAGQPGFKSRLRYDWADYFNASLKDIAVAKSWREPHLPSLEQIQVVLATMPFQTPVEKRNQALIAFTILTGTRDNAIASMRLRHVDISERMIFQDGRDMRTKFSKSFFTSFFPVGNDIEAIFIAWISYLKADLGFGPDDPLFPLTKTGFGADGHPAAARLGRECWSTAAPIRAIFKDAFKAAGLPYFNPHSFRKTLTRLGMVRCETPEAFKAWSQNLGHDKVMTTFSSYGAIPEHRQRELMQAAAARGEDKEKLLALGRAVVAATRSTEVARG